MLVLTRKAGEKIKIGDNIILSILEIEGGGVKIGIDAPKDITILRMEILDQIRNENVQAAEKSGSDISKVAELFKKKLS
ncbi:carbon storage regulator CsrA [bacterium]|nr:carbon storage regulator CsrA [bacterium]